MQSITSVRTQEKFAEKLIKLKNFQNPSHGLVEYENFPQLERTSLRISSMNFADFPDFKLVKIVKDGEDDFLTRISPPSTYFIEPEEFDAVCESFRNELITDEESKKLEQMAPGEIVPKRSLTFLNQKPCISDVNSLEEISDKTSEGFVGKNFKDYISLSNGLKNLFIVANSKKLNVFSSCIGSEVSLMWDDAKKIQKNEKSFVLRRTQLRNARFVIPSEDSKHVAALETDDGHIFSFKTCVRNCMLEYSDMSDIRLFFEIPGQESQKSCALKIDTQEVDIWDKWDQFLLMNKNLIDKIKSIWPNYQLKFAVDFMQTDEISKFISRENCGFRCHVDNEKVTPYVKNDQATEILWFDGACFLAVICKEDNTICVKCILQPDHLVAKTALQKVPNFAGSLPCSTSVKIENLLDGHQLLRLNCGFVGSNLFGKDCVYCDTKNKLWKISPKQVPLMLDWSAVMKTSEKNKVFDFVAKLSSSKQFKASFLEKRDFSKCDNNSIFTCKVGESIFLMSLAF
eukprot:GHVP01043422.1.p1 GENE.GHVP01043422.1~~GHVP01043422.1.p1  ORF type:complete len:514 (+),score=80.55 GHVP01043422.1:1-1542(+)